MSVFRISGGFLRGNPWACAALAFLFVGCAESAQRAVSADRAGLEECVSERSESAPECQVLRERLETAGAMQKRGVQND
jgi:hypothetical protein